MSTKDFTANVISATKVVPDGNFKDSKASGIWDINEVLDLIKGGNWPNVANVNPSAFVDALFQTHLYKGNGSTQTITNNINLSGSGGLVWIKNRSASSTNHSLFDSESGATGGKKLRTNLTAAIQTFNGSNVFTTSSTGFALNNDASNDMNDSTYAYVSWTFRKAPKFFDVITYTGSGSAKAIDHNLGTTPGMIIVKQTDEARDWAVFHRMFNGGGSAANFWMKLNDYGDLLDDATVWNDTVPTATQFTVGTGDYTNKNNGTYVAYLFAHNNDDGGFGEPGDQDIIKCGNYTGNNSTTGPVIDLGFEPQFVMIKNAGDQNRGWAVHDNMRGMAVGGADQRIQWNDDGAEAADNGIAPTPTGFQVESTSTFYNANSHDYIYVAIRRGGMQTPTAASDVFSATGWTGNNTANRFIDNSILTDMVWTKGRSAATGSAILDRLRGQGNILQSEGSGAEFEDDGVVTGLDFNTGFEIQTHSSINDNNATYISHAWARARGYFDIVGYTGTGSARTVAHNLGVAPEMIWIKNRAASENWVVYHSGIDGSTPEDYYLRLNQTSARIDVNGGAGNRFNRTAPTTSVFTVGTDGDVNGNGVAYISYHFATVAGVSKVGSFTQSGATNVACGFTGSTPALIILKRTDSTDNWFTFDSTRGIVAGNDKSLYMNTAGAEVTDADVVDPYSGGFATTSSLTNGDYIFYAIAAIS